MIIRISCLLHRSGLSSCQLPRLQLTSSYRSMMASALKEPSSQASPGIAAVCQFTASENKDANFSICESLIRRAKQFGAQVVFLPEACDFIGRSQDENLQLAEPLHGPLVSRYRELAKASNLWISLGGIHEKATISENPEQSELTKPATKQLGHNTHLLIADNGQIAAIYRKLHLFDIDIPGGVRLKESDFTVAGSDLLPPISTPVGNVGLATCYDLRFPEQSLCLRQQGAEILTYPSAFTPVTGAAHWEVLLRARAVETQCYVIAAAQFGKHNEKRSSYGHAMIVDPWGNVVAQCSDTTAPSLAIAEIDLNFLKTVRRNLPCNEHRRADVYSLALTRPPSVPHDLQSEYTFGQVKIPSAQVLYRNVGAYAFVNIQPVLTGHVLVSSIRLAERLADLRPEEISAVFSCVQTVQRQIEKFYNVASSTIAVQDGPDAGQTIKHLHVHIMPRKTTDFAHNDEIYQRLQEHDKPTFQQQTRRRTDAEMEAEAAEYRRLFYHSDNTTD